MSEENIEATAENNFGFKESTKFAGFWIRVGASIIDMLVLVPLFVLNWYNQMDFKSIILLYIITIFLALYKPFMEFKFGGTLGKMACKIKVVNLGLNKISIDQAFIRYIPWAISTILQLLAATSMFRSPQFKSMDTYQELVELTQNSPLTSISTYYSYIFIVLIGWLVFDKKRQGIHDKMAKTYCIKVVKY